MGHRDDLRNIEDVLDEYDSSDWVDCWQCGGEGYSHHDCGEDTCCCLNPEDNVVCDICRGKGGWLRVHAPSEEPKPCGDWGMTFEKSLRMFSPHSPLPDEQSIRADERAKILQALEIYAQEYVEKWSKIIRPDQAKADAWNILVAARRVCSPKGKESKP